MSVLVFKSYVLRILKKIATLLNKNFYYVNRYGFKQIVSIKSYKPQEAPADAKIVFCNPDEFYLSFDGLKDEYTFAGTKISDSPHYKLIEACHKGDLNGCVYLDCEYHGKLDARDTVVYTESFHMNTFEKAFKDMESGDTKPVLYYIINGKKYVFDGKHRLALYCYFKKPVPAVEINVASQQSCYVKRLQRIIRKYPHKFTKQKDIIDAIISA